MLEQLPIPLRALLRRPTRARALPFDDPESAGLHASMAIRPEDMGQMVQALAPLVLRFPRGTLQGAERAVCRRNAAPGMGAVLHEYAAALGGFGQWLEGPRRPGAVPWPPLDRNQVRLLAHRLARLDNLRLATAEALHQAIDVRLVLGALQWYMLRAVLRAV